PSRPAARRRAGLTTEPADCAGKVRFGRLRHLRRDERAVGARLRTLRLRANCSCLPRHLPAEDPAAPPGRSWKARAPGIRRPRRILRPETLPACPELRDTIAAARARRRTRPRSRTLARLPAPGPQ